MQIVRDASGLADFSGGVLVPTMGALHAGHMALIERAAALAGEGGGDIVVSLFVNPTQFNDPSDFERYPRSLEDDARKCEAAGVACLFAPDVGAVYPRGVESAPESALPRVATAPGLEDRFRPGHFAGVCAVVSRLFELTRPRAAVFGEKDWQQLCVIRAMVERAGGKIEIEPCPTVREADGMALSSRNALLSADARRRGLSIWRGLEAAQVETDPPAAERAMRRMMEVGGVEVEYAAVRDAATLEAVRPGRPARALAAGVVGGVRLIDNMPWGV
ncbi:MAG: pantoate--beta-alanine ligase [Phycisphaeraceae bacterium]|nr:MAG: pantoate--beta-alanine ligase [Phycisphaeraceae bacterium]